MKKYIPIAVALIILSAFAGGIDFLGKRSTPAINIAKAEKIAKEWVVNNSPTYKFDGFELKTKSSFQVKCSGCGYQISFTFSSSHSGYGNRTGLILAQVITPHTIVVTVSGNFRVTTAITDGVYDEIKAALLINGNATVRVFFNNSKMDPEFSCNKVFSVDRDIPKTMAPARAALDELLKGPTESEKSQGFFTTINPGVKIQSLTINGGTATVDFDEQLEFQVGGSCRVSSIRQEIIQTLKQFPSVENVIISINGRTEDILQP